VPGQTDAWLHRLKKASYGLAADMLAQACEVAARPGGRLVAYEYQAFGLWPSQFQDRQTLGKGCLRVFVRRTNAASQRASDTQEAGMADDTWLVFQIDALSGEIGCRYKAKQARRTCRTCFG
jgi:hypothetical protein